VSAADGSAELALSAQGAGTLRDLRQDVSVFLNQTHAPAPVPGIGFPGVMTAALLVVAGAVALGNATVASERQGGTRLSLSSPRD
jgi:hypothetical protein